MGKLFVQTQFILGSFLFYPPVGVNCIPIALGGCVEVKTAFLAPSLYHGAVACYLVFKIL